MNEMHGITLDELLQLNTVRTCLPKNLSTGLSTVLFERDETKRLSQLFKFVEALSAYLCDLLSSEYHAQGVSNPNFEKALLKLNREREGKLSFGHYSGAFDLFPGVIQGDYKIRAFSQIFRESLPISVGNSIHAFDKIIEAREWGIPVERVRAYVQKLSRAQSVGPKKIQSLLQAVLQARNASAHPGQEGVAPVRGDGTAEKKVKNPWWSDDPALHHQINEQLLPAVVRSLLWEPMRIVLTGYEVVEVVAPSRSDGQHFLAPVRRLQLDPPWPPMSVQSPRPLDVSAMVIVRHAESPLRLQWLMPVQPFPRGRDSREKMREMYRDAYVRCLVGDETGIGDGQIDATERALLNTIMNESNLVSIEIMEINKEVNARWFAAFERLEGTSMATGPTSLVSEQLRSGLRLWLCASEQGSALTLECCQAASDLLDVLTEHLLAVLNDKGVVHGESLAKEVGLPHDPVVVAALKRLLDRKQIAIIGAGTVDAAATVFQVQNSEISIYDAGFLQILGELEASIDQEEQVSDVVWSLLKIINQLFASLSHPGQQLRCEQLEDKARISSSGGPAESIGEDELLVASGDSLTVNLDGTSITAHRLTLLIRRVAKHIAETPQLLALLLERMDAVVPYRAGRTRYFVGFHPKHANGSEFAYPIEAQFVGRNLFFEANWPRNVAEYHFQAFLDRWIAATPGDEGEVDVSSCRPGQGDAANGDSLGGDDESCDEAEGDTPGLDVTFPDGSPPVPVRGKTVPDFLMRLLQVLSTKRVGPVGEQRLIDQVKLPVSMGRVRYFLAEAPIHRDERPFTRVVEFGGVFAEANLSWQDALQHAGRICKEVGMTSVSFEPQRVQAVLAVRLANGALITGPDVKEFVKALLDVLRDENLLADAVPYQSGSKRYFIASKPIHPSEKAFTNPLEYDADVWVECNVGRDSALKYAKALLESVGLEVSSTGEEATSWELPVEGAPAPRDASEATADPEPFEGFPT